MMPYVGSFLIGCIIQNNMEFGQVGSGAEGTHAGQDVLTFGL